MGWETRNGQQYFYEKIREGDRVVSRYIGAGEAAAKAELQMRAKAELERRRRERERHEQQEQDIIDNAVDAIGDLINSYANAHLVVAGYHWHKGQWRKQRGE
jgi:hypothetical protein